MNGRPSCWKITSWPNWNFSIVGYSPCPLPAQRPMIQASRAQSGWMFSGISNGIGWASSVLADQLQERHDADGADDEDDDRDRCRDEGVHVAIL